MRRVRSKKPRPSFRIRKLVCWSVTTSLRSSLNSVASLKYASIQPSIPGNVILDKSRKQTASAGVSLRELNKELDKIGVKVVRERQAVYTRIHHKANLVCCRTGCKGVTFTEMLLLLAHHTLIDDEEALGDSWCIGLKEPEVRRGVLRLVTDLVGLDRIRSHLQMKVVRRRYLEK